MDKTNTDSMHAELLAEQGDSVARLRAKSPHIHSITNFAANNFTANVLLALGAIPSLTSSPEEVPEFVARADALLINLGTLDGDRRDAIQTAIGVANGYRKPWILDPAFANASESRLAFASKLLKLNPFAVRANQIEIDSLCAAMRVEPSAGELALVAESCVAATGEVDIVTNGVRDFCLSGGDPMMARVTAVGCVTSAIVAAVSAIERDPLKATIVALTIAGVAGEAAAQRARGPGSFQVEFLDALYEIDDDAVGKGIRLS